MNFKEIAQNYKITGMILTGKADLNNIAIAYPNVSLDEPTETVSLTQDELEELFTAIDEREVEVYGNDSNTKILVRKGQRQMDRNIMWQVFRRDKFTCRYCGRKDVPMTYDHIKLWERMGETSLENGVSACSNCNKKRGNMDYAGWIGSEYYLKVSKRLPLKVKVLNSKLAEVYNSFPERKSARGR